jgi:hypothetical protein
MVLIAGLAWLGAAPASGQVSPGPLARVHRSLEGALKCTQCHGAGKEAMNARCVACHKDVGWLANQNRGLHGSSATKGARCSSCHPDHAGEAFELIRWPEGSRDRFDHRKAGWPLQQSHAKVDCAKCHAPAFQVAPAAKLAAGGRSNWTGLETTCTSCHEDTHRGALGIRCTSCHDAGEWAITPGFSHDTTGYALTGKHRDVGCDQCHENARLPLKRDPSGQPIPIYRPVPAQTCTACHRDVHAGSFGGTCTTCHTTAGFRQITPSGGFDHGRTRFPLRGRHATTKCAACHQNFTTDQGRRPPSATCATCHRPDPHGGAATLDGKPVDCVACHSENTFTPSTFPLARHQASRYPLEGKHRAVACAACHRKDLSPVAPVRLGPARVVIRPSAARCANCHQDDHGGQLAGSDTRDCAACHGLTGFTPSTIDQAAHAALRLPLDGRHAAIDCRACHGATRPGLAPLPHASALGKAQFALTKVEVECAACHRDPHAGRFEPSGPRANPKSCLGCHDTRAFLPTTVDVAAHQTFAFALGGAHRAAPCQACHADLANQAASASPKAMIAGPALPRRLELRAGAVCADCHRTVHGPQFETRRDRGRCDACHDDAGFAPASRFDHARDAAFALDGRHTKVACAACHRPSAPGAVVPYRPLPTKCEDCHTKR